MAQFLNMFTVDLQKPNSPQPLRTIIGEGDAKGLRVGAYVYNDGAAVSLGGSCVGKIIRADGSSETLTGTISSNQAYVVLDGTACTIDGPIQVAVCWVSGSNITTLLVVYGTVVNTVAGGQVSPSTPLPDITQLLAEIDNMRSATADANAAAAQALVNLAPAFSDSTAYTVGQYVTYTDGKLYRFTSAHAAGAWNSSQVTAVKVSGELNTLQTAVAGKQDTLTFDNVPTSGSNNPVKSGGVYSELSDVNGALDEYKDGFANLNLFGQAELLYENGYATIDDGHISVRQPSNTYNAYLLPVDGASVYSFTRCRFAFLVASDKYTAIGSLLQNVTQINSTGARYICFSVDKTVYQLTAYICSKGTTLQTGFVLPAWSDTFQDQIDTVDSRVYSIEYNSGINLFDRAELLSDAGYGNIDDGKLIISSNALYSTYLLPVDGESVYTFTYCRFAFLVASDKETAIGSLLQNVTQVDSTGASYICFSFDHNDYPVSSYEIYGIRSATSDKPKYKSVTGNLASGDNMQLVDVRNNLRKGERIVFEGNITSFSSLKIGLSFSTAVGTDTNQRNTFLIDATNISYYERSTYTPVSVAHGLSIANNIQIIWEMTDTAVCKFTLVSGGNMFEHDFTNFVRQTIGNPFVLSVNTVLTECKLTWTCVDLIKDIWMFGDSYFAYSEDRWTYYLHQYGYDKHCLLDGFPGEGGTNGRVSFNNLLAFGTPKYAVWCLGMNDTSDSSTAPATDWVTARDYFLQYCTQNNVTPIFGTIPTVPTINNEQKNAWIRSSGYRYIDFAKAVGASASGAWYSGMLSSDGVHPTEQGAKALFARVLLDLPEIMVDDFDY